MEEFRKMKSTESNVPMKRLKELYIQLMSSGQSILKDKSIGENFLSKLAPDELQKLMEILQMEPEETIK
jgi:hypothetical protein